MSLSAKTSNPIPRMPDDDSPASVRKVMAIVRSTSSLQALHDAWAWAGQWNVGGDVWLPGERAEGKPGVISVVSAKLAKHGKSFDDLLRFESTSPYYKRLKKEGNPSPGRKSACGSAGGRGNPRGPRLIDVIMAEHIPMPGFPQIIVTRGFAYQYFKRLGWDESERGYGSLDYAVFAAHKTDESLTETEERDYWLNKPDVVEGMSRNPSSSSGIKFVYGILGKGAKRVSEVQSVLLDKARYTVAQAKKWLEDHGFKSEVMDEGGAWLESIRSKSKYHRFRQHDPQKYRSMRTGEAGAKNPIATNERRAWNYANGLSSPQLKDFAQDYVLHLTDPETYPHEPEPPRGQKYEAMTSVVRSKIRELLGQGQTRNPILGIGTLPPHVLIQHPDGVWSFVGRVDARLSYLRKDGSEPTEEELRKAGQFGPGLMGLKTRVWATQEEAEQAAAELGIKVGQVSPHRKGNPDGGPEIPPVITHKNMEPLLEALQHEPEFMIGMPPVPRGPKWYRHKVTLEFPLGELAKGGLQNMALVGRLEHRTMPITGKEQFNAQGLEGKVQVEKDLFSALMNLRDLLPEHRGRIITRSMDKVKNPDIPASASVVVHTREGAAHSYGDQSHFSEAVNEAIRWTKDGGGPCWVRLYEYYPGGSILKQTRVEDGKAAVEKNPKGNPETITPVIFRKFKEDPTELVAVFPASLGTLEGDVDYYVSAGGHSAAPLQGLMSKTTPANPKEYARIKDELERSYDYRLRVVERDSPAFRAGRRKQLREYRQGNPESESDQARIEAKSNWLGTLRSTRNNRLVAVMSTIPGGIYLHWINYEGLFPAGATMSYTRADLNKRLADGTYVWVKKAPGVAENPNGASESESAAALYEQFHGRPSSETLEYHEEIEVPDELAGLGDLTEIKVATMSGLDVTLSFEDDPPKLCSTPDGKQLHIIGGDASLPLDKLKMDGDKWLRDSMVIGVLYELTYRTQKDFHRFSPTNYFHKFADPKEKRSDVEPMLIYDSVNKQLSVSGGQYEISKPGIQG